MRDNRRRVGRRYHKGKGPCWDADGRGPRRANGEWRYFGSALQKQALTSSRRSTRRQGERRRADRLRRREVRYAKGRREVRYANGIEKIDVQPAVRVDRRARG